MIKYEELYNIVKSKISKERFEHTLNVVERAIEYAKVYGVDEQRATLAALAHDIAKNDINKIEYNKYKDQFDEITMKNDSLKHAKLGGIICEEYGFDSDMINSIKYHTTGRANMSILEKIIYLADSTEKNRKFGSTQVELAKRNIDEAIFTICAWTIKKLVDESKLIHPDSINCYNYYNTK
ncbi:MAG: HD domain-containing protein [Clostridia bacterium]|nr:HD domain-containing protein [Clostridia bacterium]